MLPPYVGRTEFTRRIFAPRLIDWDGALLQIHLALTRPHRLGQLAVHRLHTHGRLARDDPGVFILLCLFSAISGLAYGCAFVASHTAVLRFPLLSTLFWGFLVYPFILLGLICLAMSTALFYSLRRFALVGRRSITMALSKSLAPIAPPATMSAVGNDKTVGWMYAFDLICNASIPGLLILFLGQYFFLPIILIHPQSITPAITLCAFVNLGLHGSAAVVFVHNLACGLSVLPTPLQRSAPLLFIPLALWILILAIFALLRVNVTTVILRTVFAFLFISPTL